MGPQNGRWSQALHQVGCTLLHGYRWQEGNDQGTGGSVRGFNGRGLRRSVPPAASPFLIARGHLWLEWTMECRVGLVGQMDIQGAQDVRDCYAAQESPPVGDQECRVDALAPLPRVLRS